MDHEGVLTRQFLMANFAIESAFFGGVHGLVLLVTRVGIIITGTSLVSATVNCLVGTMNLFVIFKMIFTPKRAMTLFAMKTFIRGMDKNMPL